MSHWEKVWMCVKNKRFHRKLSKENRENNRTTTTKKDIKFVCKSAWTTIVNKINSKSVEKEAVCVDGVYWNSNNRSIHHGPSNPKRVGVLEIDQKNTHKNKWIEMSTGFIQFASLRNLLEWGNEFYSRIAWTIFKLTLVSHGFSIRL